MQAENLDILTLKGTKQKFLIINVLKVDERCVSKKTLDFFCLFLKIGLPSYPLNFLCLLITFRML